METENFIKVFNDTNRIKDGDGLCGYHLSGTNLVYQRDSPLSYVLDYNILKSKDLFQQRKRIYVKTKDFEKMLSELMSNSHAEIDYHGAEVYNSDFPKEGTDPNDEVFFMKLGFLAGSISLQGNKLISSICFSPLEHKLTDILFGENLTKCVAESFIADYILSRS